MNRPSSSFLLLRRLGLVAFLLAAALWLSSCSCCCWVDEGPADTTGDDSSLNTDAGSNTDVGDGKADGGDSGDSGDAGDAGGSTTAKAAAQPPEGALDPQRLEDYFPLRGGTFRLGKDYVLTGQLTQPDFDLAKSQGVRSIVLVRMDRELGGLGFEPAPYIAGLGLAYVHFPIAPETMNDDVAEKFVATIRDAEKPVMIVGSNGNRVWGLWSLYLGSLFGVPVDKTKAVALENGVKKLVIEDFVRGYLSRRTE